MANKTVTSGKYDPIVGVPNPTRIVAGNALSVSVTYNPTPDGSSPCCFAYLPASSVAKPTPAQAAHEATAVPAGACAVTRVTPNASPSAVPIQTIVGETGLMNLYGWFDGSPPGSLKLLCQFTIVSGP